MEQFKTIEIPEQAFSILKAGWELELKIIESDINKFKKKIKEMEKSKSMSSKVFKKRFEDGLIGDDEWCFDWINYLDLLSELNSKYELAKKVCI